MMQHRFAIRVRKVVSKVSCYLLLLCVSFEHKFEDYMTHIRWQVSNKLHQSVERRPICLSSSFDIDYLVAVVL